MGIICWLKGIWRSVFSLQLWQGGYYIDGCDWEDTEEHKNKTVVISKCKCCKKIDISWS